MRFSLSIVLAASTLSLVSAASEAPLSSRSTVLRQSGKPASVYSHLQVTRRKLQEKHLRTASKTKEDQTDATPTSTHPEKKAPNYNKRSEPHKRRHLRPILFEKIFRELTDCLRGVQQHTQKVMDICGSRIDRFNAERVAWLLLAELRAILDLLRNCHRRVRDCDGATTPSAVPGGPGRGTPCPTLGDICRLISQLIRELKTCFALMTTLCSQFPPIRQICGETLQNISEFICIIVNVSGIHLGDVPGGLREIFRPTPRFFINLGFGFASLPNKFGLW